MLRGGTWTGWAVVPNWLLWWRVSSEELRRQVEAYDTLTWLLRARSLSLVFALIAAAFDGSLGAAALPDSLLISDWVMRSAASYLILAAVAAAVLGGLMYRGRWWAPAGLMVFCTLDRLAWLAVMTDDPHHTLPPASWLGESLLFWTASMHCYYTAYRVERARARI